MFRAFDVAVSGMRLHQTYLDVTSNNLANVNADGFKASRGLFEDRLTDIARKNGITPPPAPNGARNAAMVGLGAYTRGVEGDFHQGSFKMTNNPSDLGIEGPGYFVVGSAANPRYTRNGNFTFDNAGVMRTGDGQPVLATTGQPIRVPVGRAVPTGLALNSAGELVGELNGRQVTLGRVALARFANDEGLRRVGNTQFQATAASGPAIAGASDTNGFGRVISGVTEMSNTDIGEEFTHLILAQRGFMANNRVLMTADELADRVNNMK